MENEGFSFNVAGDSACFVIWDKDSIPYSLLFNLYTIIIQARTSYKVGLLYTKVAI